MATPHDIENWAKPVAKLSVNETAGGIAELVEGKRLVGPIQGFGKMWQKTYRVRLAGASATPAEAIGLWKDRFPILWPEGNRFYAPLIGIQPGEVALITVKGGPVRLSTGVMVLYADEESFTLMTPQGHTFAGWITFSAQADGATTVAQAQILMRAQDPLTEIALALGGHGQENRFWEQTLRNLATQLGVEAPAVETQVACIDRKRQWSRAGNLRHSIAMRSLVHDLRPRRQRT